MVAFELDVEREKDKRWRASMMKRKLGGRIFKKEGIKCYSR
jgi:hypothetical protein